MADEKTGNSPTLTAHIVVEDFDKAVAFYKDVFGAVVERRNAGPDGKVWHGEVRIGGSDGTKLHLVESFEDMGLTARAGDPTAASRQNDYAMFDVYVDNVDGAFERAIAAGSVAIREPHDAFWGDRYAEFRGPDGHRWSISSPNKQMSEDEQQKNLMDYISKTKSDANG